MSTKKKPRRQHSIEKKASILRAHLGDKKPVSDLCDEHELQPSVFYGWQRALLENAEAALRAGTGRRREDSRERKLHKEIEALKAKLAKKNEIIAEISEEYVTLKKELGEP